MQLPKINRSSYSFLLFIIGFWIIRLPFYLNVPIPFFTNDAFDYYSFVEVLNSEVLPDFSVIPPGYPLYLFFVNYFSFGNTGILFFQSLAMCLSSLYLIAVINKSIPKLAIVTAIVLFVYTSLATTIQLETSIYTEALYIPSIIALIGALVMALLRPSMINWMVLSIMLVVPAIIRSNGMFAYVLLVPIVWYVIRNKLGKSHLLAFLMPFVMVNLFWAAYNYGSAGLFYPGNPKRVATVFGAKSVSKKQTKNAVNKSNGVWLKTIAADVMAINREENSFYDGEIPRRYNYLIDSTGWQQWKSDYILEKQIRSEMYSYQASGDVDSLIQYCYKGLGEDEFASSTKMYIDSYLYNGEGGRYYCFRVLNRFFTTINAVCYHWIWIVLFAVVFIWIVWKNIQLQFKNNWWFCLLLVAGLHILSTLVLGVSHARMQPRYVVPTELVYYLLVGWGVVILFNPLNNENKKAL